MAKFFTVRSAFASDLSHLANTTVSSRHYMERRVNSELKAFPAYEKPQPFLPQENVSSRPRRKSLSEQTTEVAKYVAPPISWTLVGLCLMWYMSSAVSNTIAKSILNSFGYPATLTMVQFVYAVAFSGSALLLTSKYPAISSLFPRGTLGTTGIQGPNRYIFTATAPMAGFQLCGHLLSYTAMSQIPVSLVHAIKSLSPLFTVGAYRTIIGTKYKPSTYVALVPLTLGVIMTCSAEFRAQPFAIFEALCSTLIFVSQNIYSKRLLTLGATAANQPTFDKMTILGWCAGLAFIGTLPIWVVTDGLSFLTAGIEIKGSVAKLLFLFTLNGFSHFCQNLLSFLVLGSISPVSYSIASLLKRIVVITAAIGWFGQPISSQQGWGIVISFLGLYLYDRFGGKVESQESDLPT